MSRASEPIHLFGGPSHNMRILWQGGDTVLIPITEDGEVYDAGMAHSPPSSIEFKTAMYVRSRRNPSIYVYQPE